MSNTKPVDNDKNCHYDVCFLIISLYTIQLVNNFMKSSSVKALAMPRKESV